MERGSIRLCNCLVAPARRTFSFLATELARQTERLRRLLSLLPSVEYETFLNAIVTKSRPVMFSQELSHPLRHCLIHRHTGGLFSAFCPLLTAFCRSD